ncbi:hypothetical protein B0T17DRAFT_199833 [Bombardia bombarda]|uniref:Uncharacterized protein n=1 Tax=Bombardia bombarda TaxID=252184 RepID=A0AA40C977_9PEZI|nr:hypothetical protein B0T17DRAFT_199833 [Bombardia bombarda]
MRELLLGLVKDGESMCSTRVSFTPAGSYHRYNTVRRHPTPWTAPSRGSGKPTYVLGKPKRIPGPLPRAWVSLAGTYTGTWYITADALLNTQTIDSEATVMRRVSRVPLLQEHQTGMHTFLQLTCVRPYGTPSGYCKDQSARDNVDLWPSRIQQEAGPFDIVYVGLHSVYEKGHRAVKSLRDWLLLYRPALLHTIEVKWTEASVCPPTPTPPSGPLYYERHYLANNAIYGCHKDTFASGECYLPCS